MLMWIFLNWYVFGYVIKYSYVVSLRDNEYVNIMCDIIFNNFDNLFYKIK